MTGPMRIEEAKYFYDEMKIADKSIFFEGSDKKLLIRR
jgi:hypothetical protein